ncbi:MAG: spore cortex biosynthesis protein YabQ [Clostridia bacterium]|nr:spore cortex biosynthesis protein YabQ [Clostridia bacterium]
MSTFVSQQFFEFMVLLYGGIVAAFVYDVLKLYQNKFKPQTFFLTFQDILYWIMTTSMVIYLLYYSSLGQIKGYMAVAFIAGCSIYKWILSKMIQTTIITIAGCLFAFLKRLKNILIFPIRNIIKMKNKKEEI